MTMNTPGSKATDTKATASTAQVKPLGKAPVNEAASSSQALNAAAAANGSASESDALKKELSALTSAMKDLQTQLLETHNLAAQTAGIVNREQRKETLNQVKEEAETTAEELHAAAEAVQETQGMFGKIGTFVKNNWVRAVVGTTSIGLIGATAYGVMKYREDKADQPLLQDGSDDQSSPDVLS